jgi:hypothetical protein
MILENPFITIVLGTFNEIPLPVERDEGGVDACGPPRGLDRVFGLGPSVVDGEETQNGGNNQWHPKPRTSD